MTIFLTILKVILTIILILLLIILGLVLLILFCPICYRIKGNLKKDIKASDGGGEVRWLFGIVGVIGEYAEKEVRVYLRIFKFRKLVMTKSLAKEKEEEDDLGIEELEALLNDAPDLGGSRQETEVSEKSGEEENHPEQIAPETVITEAAEAESKAELKAEAADEEKPEAPPKVEIAHIEETEHMQNLPDEMFEEEAEPEIEEEEVIPPPYILPEEEEETDTRDLLHAKLDEIAAKLQSILNALDNLPPNVEAKVEKVRGLLDKGLFIKDKVVELLSVPAHQKAIRHVLRELVYILKTLIPERLRADLTYSAGAPDLTGKILALLSCFRFPYNAKWRMDPDFGEHKPYAEGELELKGSIWLYKYVGAVLRLVFDINIWKLVKAALKLKKTLKA